MYDKDQNTRGFTFVEFLVVLAILIIVLGITVIGFQNFAGYQQFNQAVADVQYILNRAHTDARSAVDDSAHGVKFAAGSVTEFTGDVYAAADPDNIVNTYQLVTFDVELTGGVDEITFDKLTGLPSATGTVVVEGTAFSASTTITISSTGVIE